MSGIGMQAKQGGFNNALNYKQKSNTIWNKKHR